MNSESNHSIELTAGKQLWPMVFVAIFTTVIIAALLFYGTQEYVLNRAENNIQNLLLSQQGIHEYVQEVMHPAYYRNMAEGKIKQDFYSPELLSSSFIMRNQYGFYNEARKAAGLPELYYKLAAKNPRNPVNKADPMESELIERFNKDRSYTKHSQVVTFGSRKFFYVALPFLQNSANCLKCHGNRKDAPEELQKLYDGEGGFNEKAGEIRAIISARAPLEREVFDTLIIFSALLAGVVTIIVLFFLNKCLKTRVFERTRALENEVNVRLKAEEEILEEKERFKVTLACIGDGVITTDLEGKVVLVNNVAQKLTGWSQQEASGCPLSEVFKIVNEETGKPCSSTVDKVLSSGEIVGFTNHSALISRDGSKHSIEDSGAPIINTSGKIIGIVMVFRDVTEQRRTEEELLKIRKLESVGVLAGGIAHDFNNILCSILGNIELASTYTSSESEARPLLDQAIKASVRAKELTRQLLTFAKGGEPVKEVASIASMITDSADFVLRDSSVVCNYDIPEDLLKVEVDGGQISQVLQNIVINASQAMPEGGVINVICENVKDPANESFLLQEKKYIKIKIVDSGEGIPEKYVDRIFDPFFSTKHSGSGLGLAICHSIITKHEGHILVKSEPGKGTIFTIYLPAIADEDNSTVQTATSIEKCRKGAFIMVMDDDEMICKMARRMLERRGHDVVLARDGLEAIEVYKKHLGSSKPIDLIIMDLTIPGGLGGKDAVKKILKIDPDALVAVSSGYSNDPVMSDYGSYGFKAAIAKPFTMAELDKAISTILG
jgi:PAS domain S-box-containing protein